jgi:hypothetical protein
MSCSTKSWARQEEILPALMGINATVAANASAITSNTWDMEGWNQLELQIFLDRTATTSLSWYFEVKSSADTTWKRWTTSSIAAGTETVAYHTAQMTGITSDVDFLYTLGGVNVKSMRVIFTSTGGTTDTLTVRGRKAVV